MKIIKSFIYGLMMSSLALLAMTNHAGAVSSQAIEIHVSISATKSLTTNTTFYDFGALAVNSSSNSATAIVVTNNSGGLTETYTLLAGNAVSDSGSTDWTLAASTGTDQYALAAQMSTARPANTDAAWDATDYMTTSAQACTTTKFGNGVAAESGAGVNPPEARNLWFRIHTPDVLTDPGGHTATVTLAVQ